MYRATAMSALGPDYIRDVVDAMAGQVQRRRSHTSFTAHWRKKAGLLYYERRSDGRYRIMRNGAQALASLFSTLAGVRGRIAWEHKRERQLPTPDRRTA